MERERLPKRGLLQGLGRGGLSFALLVALALILVSVDREAADGTDWADLALADRERLLRLARYTAGMTLAGAPALTELDKRLEAGGHSLGAPVLIRIFKLEFVLELWLRRGDRFHLFATYPICRWSGRLGPKLSEGDRQAPEGFYTVDASQLNPRSRWHRAFNLGFPNAFDRAHGRTGTFLMVHGGCSSVGCYAMTDPVIDEIWRIVGAALKGGQTRFQVQAYPFRLTGAALEMRKASPSYPFWLELKAGFDAFEATGVPPVAAVCAGQYDFNPGRAGSDGSAPIGEACLPRANSRDGGATPVRHNRLARSGRGS